MTLNKIFLLSLEEKKDPGTMNIDKGRYELYLKSNAHKNFSSIKFSDAGR